MAQKGVYMDLDRHIGKRFGRLMVQDVCRKDRGGNIKRRIRTTIYYRCKCDCGNIKDIERSNIISGTTNSCGCLASERSRKRILVARQNLKYKPKLPAGVIGQRSGRLVVLRVYHKFDKISNTRFIECLCDCGIKVNIRYNTFKQGYTRSCGCLRRESLSERAFKHGMGNTKIYGVWAGIISRCCSPTNPAYKHYGGRGITVCDRWRKSFEAFYDDIGDIPRGLQLDRIDNNLGYFKDNVKFSTSRQNTQNQRSSKWWIINKVWYPSLSAASEMLNVSVNKIMRMCDGRMGNGRFCSPQPGCYSESKYPSCELWP